MGRSVRISQSQKKSNVILILTGILGRGVRFNPEGFFSSLCKKNIHIFLTPGVFLFFFKQQFMLQHFIGGYCRLYLFFFPSRKGWHFFKCFFNGQTKRSAGSLATEVLF